MDSWRLLAVSSLLQFRPMPALHMRGSRGGGIRIGYAWQSAVLTHSHGFVRHPSTNCGCRVMHFTLGMGKPWHWWATWLVPDLMPLWTDLRERLPQTPRGGCSASGSLNPGDHHTTSCSRGCPSVLAFGKHPRPGFSCLLLLLRGRRQLHSAGRQGAAGADSRRRALRWSFDRLGPLACHRTCVKRLLRLHPC